MADDDDYETGSFYTSQELADQIAERVMRPQLETLKQCDSWRAFIEALSTYRVIDPFVGDGAFLKAATRLLVEVIDHQVERFPDDQNRADAIGWLAEECVNGADINESAVEATRAALREIVGDQSARFRTVQVGDSLTGPLQPKDVSLGDKDGICWLRFDGYQGYDAVLTNPPWITLKNTKTSHRYLNNQNRKLLEHNYPKMLEGHLNTYVFGAHRALSMLKEGRGRIGIVLPASFCSDPERYELREYARHTLNHRLDLFPFSGKRSRDVFPGVNQSFVVLMGDRRTDRVPFSLIVHNEWEETHLMENRYPTHIPRTLVDTLQMFPFQYDNPSVEKVFDRQETRIGDSCEFYAGIQAFSKNTVMLDVSNVRDERHQHPYFTPSDILPFQPVYGDREHNCPRHALSGLLWIDPSPEELTPVDKPSCGNETHVKDAENVRYKRTNSKCLQPLNLVWRRLRNRTKDQPRVQNRWSVACARPMS